ncbi:MAG: dihydroorotate dehydrogenase electron transfer subunit [Anaerotignum sp.]
MKQSIFTIKKNEPLTNTVYHMVLEGDTSAITQAGQFINIKLNDCFLRRPISICDYDESTITILYKVVGKGTNLLSQMPPLATLDILVGLGNGYDTTKSGDHPLLIGGGVGIPPMYHLAKRLIAEGKNPTIILGFNAKAEAFYLKEFESLGANVLVATADGSLGTKGFVTNLVDAQTDYTYFYTCGPEAMLKAITDSTKTNGQLSFEERMGCGFGACMGCSCQTKYGNKRICKEGPVLEKEEIIW